MPVISGRSNYRATLLAQVKDLLSVSLSGSGGLALIEGGLASGKTYLLHELADHAEAAGALVLTAAGSSAERSLELGLADQLFRSAGLRASVPDFAERLARTCGASVRENGPTGALRPDTLDARIRELCDLLLDLCADRAVLLAVDDIQYGDAASLQWLLSLRRRMGSSKLLMVLTKWRRGERALLAFQAELTRYPYKKIRLSPLSVQEIADQLVTETEMADTRQLAHEFHEITGGNPLLLHAVIEDNADFIGTRQEEKRGRPAVGLAYAHALLTGLYRWDAELLNVARAAAVLGEHSTTRLIAQLLGTRLEDNAEIVRILSDAGFLRGERIRYPSGGAVLLDNMEPSDRADLHMRAAKLLYQQGVAAVDVARHLLAADEVADYWAVTVLRSAADQALASGDSDTAARCLELAVGAAADNRERAIVMFLLVRALWRENPATATLYLPYLQGAVEEGELPAYAAVEVVRYSLWHGETDLAIKAAAALTSTPDPLNQRLAAELSAVFHWYLGSDRRLGLPDSGGLKTTPRKDTWADAINRMTTLWIRGGSDVSVASAQDILRSSQVGDTAVEVIAGAVLALMCGNKPELARSWCEILIQEAVRFGETTCQAVLGAISASVALRLGDLSAAVDQAKRALEMLPAKSWGVLIGQPLATLIAAWTCLGDYQAAAEILRRPVPSAMFDTFPGLRYLDARGHFYLATGQALAAGADFQRCGRLVREWESDLPALNHWRSNLAQVNLELGNIAEARELIRQQLDRARAGDTRARGISLRVLAAASELPRRPALLRQSVEFLTTAQDRVELARALSEFSAVHQELGEFDRARLLARRAAQITKVCLGSVPAAGQDRADANPEPATQAQVGVRQDVQQMRQALSDAEHRVAELAALGHTNREISRTLFITVSTVEQHLTRVYRKLGITRRTDLLEVYELRAQGPEYQPDSLVGNTGAARDLLPRPLRAQGQLART